MRTNPQLKQSGRFYTEEMGWKIVPLHGVINGKACTCYKGTRCFEAGSAGKHPVMKEWDKNAISDPDTLDRQIDKQPQGNLGLLIGPTSGVIDIEFDDEVGRATAEKLFADVVTPSYESERSRHYLFKWSARLPDVQKVEPSDGPLAGLEIRIGNGEKATQSVLPPSRHYKGKSYRWVDGMHPAQVELAELPREVLAVLVNYDPNTEKGSGGKYKRHPGLQRLREGKTIEEGERNDVLYKHACGTAELYAGKLRYDDKFEEFSIAVHAINQYRFKPPLPDDEVDEIIAGSRKFGMALHTNPNARPEDFRSSSSDGANANSDPMKGLDYDPISGETRPGQWKLYRVNADPQFFQLLIPSAKDFTLCKDGLIRIELEDIDNARAMALRILKGTGGQFTPLNMPGSWSTIWNGQAAKEKKAGFPGLRRELMAQMETVDADPFDERWRELLGYLLGRLRGCCDFQIREGEDGKEEAYLHPGVYDLPHKHPDGSVWFKWDPLWQDARSKKLFTESEIRSLRLMVGVKGVGKKPHRYEERDKWAKGSSRFIRFSEKKLESLEKLLE